jgi:hypothetical protein
MLLLWRGVPVAGVPNIEGFRLTGETAAELIGFLAIGTVLELNSKWTE